MKTLYVSDLDGTLLDRDGTLGPYTLKTLNALISDGVSFTYATARSYASAARVTQGLRLTLPAVAYGGALIVRPDTGRAVSWTTIPQEGADDLVRAFRELDLSPLVYSLIGGTDRVSWLTTRVNDGIRNYLNSRRGDARLRPVTDEPRLYDGIPFYFTCIGERDELLPLFERFSGDPRFNVSLHRELYREEYWCEITSSAASKAGAVARIKSICGFDRVVSFGDTESDLDMLLTSDESYAVADAAPALREAATAVIGSNSADGVAIWLSEHAQRFEPEDEPDGDAAAELALPALSLLPAGERARACCFTGHRSMTPEERRELTPRLGMLVLDLYREGYRRFYVGGAYGFDLLAGLAVVAAIRNGCKDIELVLACPFPGHDSRWQARDRELLRRIRAYASEEVCVCPVYFPGAYAARNRYMIERTSACVAYYLPGREQSGTGQTVRLAEQAGHKVYIL